MHWDGVAWSPVVSNTIGHLSAIWGSSAHDVWAVAGGVGGGNNLIHWDGQAWSPAPADTSMNLAGVWGTAPNDVWAVGGGGYSGVITHFDGSAWHLSSTTSSCPLKGVWGSGPSDVWAAGQPYGPITPTESNSILHLVAGVWTPVADNAPNEQAKDLTAVWAASTGEAWASGYGAILYWNGTVWTPSKSGTFYEHVWGRAPNDVWAAGSGLVHFDGVSWVDQGINDVHLYAVGGAGAAAAGHQGVWAGGKQAVFELIPGSTLTCQTVGGTCGGSCTAAEGHLSDYSCDNGGTCCVSLSACGGVSEPGCCRTSDRTLVPGRRPTCRDGTFSCGSDAYAAFRCGGP
jgi:hypothetical protein